ncbi:hypothetical protein Ancab_020555 [Ancistrocladus abbreviatus]
MATYCLSLLTVSQLTPAKTPPFIKKPLILRTPFLILHPSHLPPSSSIFSPNQICGATPPQKYVYPDPILEFAQAETRIFKVEIAKKLMEDGETFGDELDAVVNVCAEILGEFLRTEYGGPGTLLVEPFTYMLVALKEKKLPGAPLAARASLLWAQSDIDHDWGSLELEIS